MLYQISYYSTSNFCVEFLAPYKAKKKRGGNQLGGGNPSNGMGGLLQASGHLAWSKPGDELAEEFRVNTEKLFKSALADWMKLEAFKEFIVPKLDYVLRSTLAHKKLGKNLDMFVRKTVTRFARANM